jgi:DNA-binding transcriptional regulator YdaS (Cro superfamily)
MDDLPAPVITFLNVIGAKWPYIDEDAVARFASLVRGFGAAMRTAHGDATVAVQGIAQAYESSSTDKMRSGWAELSARHVMELIDASHGLADALDAAAAYIVAQKAAAIVELTTMAAAFAADQAAAVATLGLAEAAVPAVVAGARAVTQSLAQDLEQHIVGEVVEASAKPLFEKVSRAVVGLDWSQQTASEAPQTSTRLSLDAQAVRRHTAALREHAKTVRLHTALLRQGLQELSF